MPNPAVQTLIETIEGGGVWIHGRLQAPKTAPSGPMVSGSDWLLEMIRFNDCSRTFGLFYASFAIVDFDIPELTVGGPGDFVGYSAPGSPPADWLQSSMFFDLGDVPLATTPASLVKHFKRWRPHRCLEAGVAASSLSRKMKHLISTTYKEAIPIARMATELGVSHAHVTRQFRRDFGFTPVNYRHRLRVSDATARLFRGEKVLNAGQNAGFDDTSRFYQNFRKITGSPPGKCRL